LHHHKCALPHFFIIHYFLKLYQNQLNIEFEDQLLIKKLNHWDDLKDYQFVVLTSIQLKLLLYLTKYACLEQFVYYKTYQN
jgi:hypothetical protein